jgi:hypothetical protein
MIDIFDISFSASSIDDVMRPATKPTRVRLADAQMAAIEMAGSSDPLIHIAQNDFWKLGHDDQGYFVERLVDDASGPVGG